MITTMTLTPTDVGEFFSTIGQLVSAADQIDDELAFRVGARFNVLDFMRPDENRISEILADLLDPRGLHGQGDRFLIAFLEILEIGGPGPAQLWRAGRDNELTVVLERPTANGRRIDIVLEFRTEARKAIIGIENKPWAVDQERQLADYGAALAGWSPEQFFLVYLSGNGQKPAGDEYRYWCETVPEKSRRMLSYNGSSSEEFLRDSLRTWLTRCAQLAEAEKVRWFLRDLSTWIERQFYFNQVLEKEEDAHRRA